jgi:hypothetical protein
MTLGGYLAATMKLISYEGAGHPCLVKREKEMQ